MPPAGGLPPSLRQSPPNAGPVTMPQGNQGNVAAALSKVNAGLKLLEEALPLIPMGSEEHMAVLDAIKGLSKHLKKGEENAQLEQAALIQQLKSAPNQAQMAAMARKFWTLDGVDSAGIRLALREIIAEHREGKLLDSFPSGQQFERRKMTETLSGILSSCLPTALSDGIPENESCELSRS